MADEDTTQIEDETTSSNLVFSEDEIATLEQEFPDESAQNKGEKTDETEGDDEPEDDEDLDGFDTDDEDDEDTDTDGDTREGDEETREGEREEDEVDEEEDETFTLVVDGQEIEVDSVDDLAALAQKGVFYEKRAAESKQSLDNANFTMKAMINDHFGFLEEFYAQKFGDYESARQHVAKLAHAYVVPYYKELQAEPDQQAQLKENRRLQREARQSGQQNQQNQQGQGQEPTFSQQDIEQLQTLEHNVNVALGEVGLPQDSEPLRKRMADIMLGAIDRNEYMHPLNAAKILLRERKDLQRELARTVPKKGRKGGKSRKQTKADIAAAKTRRSAKKPGPEGRGRRARQSPRTFTGREFINSLDQAMGLEP